MREAEQLPLLLSRTSRSRYHATGESTVDNIDFDDSDAPPLLSETRTSYSATLFLSLLGCLLLLSSFFPYYYGDTRPSSQTRSTAWLAVQDPLYNVHHKGKIKRALKQLEHEMDGGSVVFQKDTSFSGMFRIFSNRVDPTEPYAVVLPSNAQDVALALSVLIRMEQDYRIRWTQKTGAAPPPDGIVLSVSNLNSLTIAERSSDDRSTEDASVAVATIGAGVTNVDLIDQGLVERSYGGVIPLIEAQPSSVMMGNWALSGGSFGLGSRLYGLGLDNVLSLQVVLADSSIVTASSTVNPELFWALRGAGGGYDLGVVTELEYKLYPIQCEQLVATAKLPNKHTAQAFMSALGISSSEIDRRLGFRLKDDLIVELTWLVADETQRLVGRSAIGKLVQELLPSDVTANLHYEVSSVCNRNGDDSFESTLTGEWNGFLMSAHANDPMDWAALLQGLQQLSDLDHTTFIVEMWGGAVQSIAPDATSFPWRDGLFSVSVQLTVPLSAKNAKKVFEKTVRKIDKVWKDVSQLLHGVHSSYSRPENVATSHDYPKLYWGSNLERLEGVKLAYDPKDSFHGPQSIPTPDA